jgi:hypothetical protein
MNTRLFSILMVASLALASCKKAQIRHELSGTWSVEEATVSYYGNGILDSTKTYENPGTLRLTDTGEDEFNRCLVDLEGYFPYGCKELLVSPEMDSSYIHWYANTRDRDRITFWASRVGFPYPSNYTRSKRGRGAGRTEEWMYIELDSIQKIAVKEVITLKLTDVSGKID